MNMNTITADSSFTINANSKTHKKKALYKPGNDNLDWKQTKMFHMKTEKLLEQTVMIESKPRLNGIYSHVGSLREVQCLNPGGVLSTSQMGAHPILCRWYDFEVAIKEPQENPYWGKWEVTITSNIHLAGKTPCNVTFNGVIDLHMAPMSSISMTIIYSQWATFHEHGMTIHN